MFGIYSLAEAVNILCDKEGLSARYGKDPQANALGYRISEQLAEFVTNTPVRYGWQQRALLHASIGDQRRYRHHAGRASSLRR